MNETKTVKQTNGETGKLIWTAEGIAMGLDKEEKNPQTLTVKELEILGDLYSRDIQQELLDDSSNY